MTVRSELRRKLKHRAPTPDDPGQCPKCVGDRVVRKSVMIGGLRGDEPFDVWVYVCKHCGYCESFLRTEKGISG